MTIIDFKWCEKHGMERPGMNVATDKSMCLLSNDKNHYIIVYTERTTGEKELYVMNPENKKTLTFTMPKINFKSMSKNDFTTDDIKTMCGVVGLSYPFEDDYI
jgi:hypothetical protein